MKEQQAKIPALSRTCASCGAPFPPGAEVYSVMSLREAGRRDLCPACFSAAQAGSAADQVHWKTRRPIPSRGEATVDLDSVTELFHRLLADPRPEVAGLRYVVALLLVRKRRIKLAQPTAGTSDEESGQGLLVQDPREGTVGTVIELPAPELSPEALERLKREFLESLTWNA